MDTRKLVVRGMVIPEPGKMEMRMFPKPVIGDDDALMKVEMVSVCGTEHGIYSGKKNNKVHFPLLPGHEVIGRIEEIGKNKTALTGIHAGDRVVVETRFGCGVCEACLKGQYTKCSGGWGYGYEIPCTVPPYLWGAYSDYLYVPARGILHKISETVKAEAGVLTCAVLGNSVRWMSHAGGCKLGDVVFISGCGRQGLGLVVAAREAGASKIIISDIRKSYEKLLLAKEFGADEIIVADEEDVIDRVRQITCGRFADIAIDTSGQPACGAMTLDLVRKFGTVVIPGLYGGAVAMLDLDKIMFKELTLRGVHTHDMDSVSAAIRIIESGKYPLEKMVTHHFSLSESEKALRIAAHLDDDGTPPINVVITPDEV